MGWIWYMFHNTYIITYSFLLFTRKNSRGEQIPCKVSVESPGRLERGTQRELWAYWGDRGGSGGGVCVTEKCQREGVNDRFFSLDYWQTHTLHYLWAHVYNFWLKTGVPKDSDILLRKIFLSFIPVHVGGCSSVLLWLLRTFLFNRKIIFISLLEV